MEEGPEPHEGVERMVEHHHHEASHGGEAKHSATMVPAITAAVLAVCAAVGSLLSGHAANEAILGQSEANDQWALYQAKSTKGHIYRADQELLDTLAALQGDRREQVQSKLDDFKAKVAKYEEDKARTRHDAEEVEGRSKYEFRKHLHYSLGVAAFQIGIVLASISILVRNRVLYGLSIAAGAVGVLIVLTGLLMRQPPLPPESAQPEAAARPCRHAAA